MIFVIVHIYQHIIVLCLCSRFHFSPDFGFQIILDSQNPVGILDFRNSCCIPNLSTTSQNLDLLPWNLSCVNSCHFAVRWVCVKHETITLKYSRKLISKTFPSLFPEILVFNIFPSRSIWKQSTQLQNTCLFPRTGNPLTGLDPYLVNMDSREKIIILRKENTYFKPVEFIK